MLANRRLARKIADIGLYEYRRQPEYKANLNGAELVIASRWFLSGKMCSVCGRIVEDLPLSAREWTCQCGAVHGREINGATKSVRFR
jgi:putative transposase